MDLNDFKKQLDTNTENIIKNMNQIHQNSGALEILKDFKGDNRRMFVILLIVLFLWAVTLVYLIITLNDLNTIYNREQEIDTSSIEYSDIINGDYYGED